MFQLRTTWFIPKKVYSLDIIECQFNYNFVCVVNHHLQGILKQISALHWGKNYKTHSICLLSYLHPAHTTFRFLHSITISIYIPPSFHPCNLGHCWDETSFHAENCSFLSKIVLEVIKFLNKNGNKRLVLSGWWAIGPWALESSCSDRPWWDMQRKIWPSQRCPLVWTELD